jgi:hypothetical protein
MPFCRDDPYANVEFRKLCVEPVCLDISCISFDKARQSPKEKSIDQKESANNGLFFCYEIQSFPEMVCKSHYAVLEDKTDAQLSDHNGNPQGIPRVFWAKHHLSTPRNIRIEGGCEERMEHEQRTA